MREPDTVNTVGSGGVAASRVGWWQGTAGGLERFPAPAAAPQTHRPPGSITCRATETSTPTTPTLDSSNMLAVID